MNPEAAAAWSAAAIALLAAIIAAWQAVSARAQAREAKRQASAADVQAVAAKDQVRVMREQLEMERAERDEVEGPHFAGEGRADTEDRFSPDGRILYSVVVSGLAQVRMKSGPNLRRVSIECQDKDVGECVFADDEWWEKPLREAPLQVGEELELYVTFTGGWTDRTKTIIVRLACEESIPPHRQWIRDVPIRFYLIESLFR